MVRERAGVEPVPAAAATETSRMKLRYLCGGGGLMGGRSYQYVVFGTREL